MNQCSICDTSLQNGKSPILTTCCGHVFHVKCVQWSCTKYETVDCTTCQKPFALQKALQKLGSHASANAFPVTTAGTLSNQHSNVNESDRKSSQQPNQNADSIPFSSEIATKSEYMKPIGHIKNFPKNDKSLNSHESLELDLYLEGAQLVANPAQILKLRQNFLIYEDNFKSTVAQAIGRRLSFADLCRVCSKYDKEGIKQHEAKSAQTMNYFTDRGLKPDAAQACAFALCFYTGSNSGRINRGASVMARRGNGEVTNIFEDTEADHASIIMYYMILGLSHIKFYWGTATRAVNMHDDELDEYFEGALITWIQFSSSMKGDRPAPHFAKRNAIFTIYSLTGREIKEFSNFPDEDEVLFMPHSSFLVTRVIRNELQSRIFVRQVELGLCQHSILWVDDHIFDKSWGNKEHMEKAATLGGEVSVHFIPKEDYRGAIAFLKSEFGQRLQGKPNFRIVTDMHRDNEKPAENAGARLLLKVRKLGFNCPCLVFTMHENESMKHVEQLLNIKQRENVQVTASTDELERFVSFK